MVGEIALPHLDRFTSVQHRDVFLSQSRLQNEISNQLRVKALRWNFDNVECRTRWQYSIIHASVEISLRNTQLITQNVGHQRKVVDRCHRAKGNPHGTLDLQRGRERQRPANRASHRGGMTLFFLSPAGAGSLDIIPRAVPPSSSSWAP